MRSKLGLPVLALTLAALVAAPLFGLPPETAIAALALIALVGWRCARALADARRSASIALRARDQALASSHAKSIFVATVSHELRTPLSGVIGMTELLLDTSLSTEQREYAEIVRSSGDGLMLVINDILDYSKIEAGKLELVESSFVLRETVAEGCAALLVVARNKGVELDVIADRDVPQWVCGDPVRLRQVVINLVSNAVKFTAAGGVQVRLRRVAGEGPGVRVRVEVLDTGIGIAPEVLERLFEPYSQGEHAIARRYGGTGLGLSISAQLVELMGGTIGATSVAGEGSAFWFELPLRLADGAPAVEDDIFELPPAGEDGAAPLVLVAEDNPVNQILAARLLERAGYRAEIVANGRQAVDAVRQTAYDAVLMDCRMPELDGYAATREIRALEGSERRLPIIAMTAESMAGDRERCLAAGMDDYVSKPIRCEELAAVLERRLAASLPDV